MSKFQLLNLLNRDGLVKLLENAGIQCYDSESEEVLKEAARVNIEDGTISREQLEAVAFDLQ